MHVESMRMQTHPRTLTQKQNVENIVETKTKETNNLTCFKIGKLCKPELNKHIITKINKRNKEMKIKTNKRKEKRDLEHYLKPKAPRLDFDRSSHSNLFIIKYKSDW